MIWNAIQEQQWRIACTESAFDVNPATFAQDWHSVISITKLSTLATLTAFQIRNMSPSALFFKIRTLQPRDTNPTIRRNNHTIRLFGLIVSSHVHSRPCTPSANNRSTMHGKHIYRPDVRHDIYSRPATSWASPEIQIASELKRCSHFCELQHEVLTWASEREHQDNV